MSLSVYWENIFNRDRKQLTIQETLKKNILFKDLSLGELKLVQNIIHFRQYSQNEFVFKQGDVGVGMYIIINGSVDIIYDRNHITTLKEDDFFGELALVEDHGKRTASALVKEESQLLGFFKPDLLEITHRNPEIGVKILFRIAQVLGLRMHETTALIRTLRRDSQ
ncbi:MAG: cyclic nucleotide-binding domain-containing protein [Bdellovibrionales bacterium]|nr:cyclic nucleotide-binding domain-containing protein [Bdellovibrionales bacterium]